MDVRDCPVVLRQQLSDEGVAALADVLAEERSEMLALVCSTFDQRLAEECGKLRTDMQASRVESRSDINAVRSDLKVAAAEVKTDVLKCSFGFWIGQVVAVVGLLKLIP